MQIKIKYNHKIFSAIVFLISISLLSAVAINEFTYWDWQEALFFNSANIIYVTIISYIFYRNGLPTSNKYLGLRGNVLAILFLLALFVNGLTVISAFSVKDLPASICIFIMNIFFTLPVLIVISLIIFIIVARYEALS